MLIMIKELSCNGSSWECGGTVVQATYHIFGGCCLTHGTKYTSSILVDDNNRVPICSNEYIILNLRDWL